jgi:single-strand DNA-binding protein
MKDLNKVIITGNLGHDPEMIFTQNGNAVVRLNLGSHRKVRQLDGSYQEKTQWTRVVMWNQLAELATEYLTKGSRLMVEGRLETRQYQDSQGLTRWVTEVVASEMYLLGNNAGRTQPHQAEAEETEEAEVEARKGVEMPLPVAEEEEAEVAAEGPSLIPPLRLVVPVAEQPEASELTEMVETSPVAAVVERLPEAKADPWSRLATTATGKRKAARQIFEVEPAAKEEESLPLSVPQLISAEQRARIEQLVKDKGYSFQAADGSAVKLFGVKVAELTKSQAEEMLSRLARLKEKIPA